MGNILLNMKGITKRFPGVLALDNVDLTLYEGEVLALVGENGAGKSTLLKILSGAYSKDEGVIEYQGKKLSQYTPQEAIDMGISIIYQELDNYQTLTVAENILVNQLPRKFGDKGPIDWPETYRRAESIIKQITDDVDVKALMNTLSTSQQQLVEIAKAMSHNMKILVMDEPTSALTQVETKRLLKLVRELAAKGIGIIYISHRMDEIFEVSDRIQVMRDGKSITVFKASETNQDEIINAMVGRELNELYPHKKMERGKPVLEVEGLSAGKARNISFTLHEGEIVGLFGLMGAGRSDLARALFGDLHVREGTIKVCGKEVSYHTPAEAIKNSIAYVPGERKNEGLMLIHTVLFNMSISIVNRLFKRLRINKKEECAIGDKWVEALNIRTPSTETVIQELSGGNQQKVVIAKWLETNPKILILNEPTRGIDVGAKAEIYNIMEELCEKGIGIIMISSEMQEVISMSDRIIVMCEGRLTGEVAVEEATQENLMRLAVGGI